MNSAEKDEKQPKRVSFLSLSDIFEVAFLLTKGCKYKRMEMQDRRVRFIFEASDYKILEKLYGDDETVSPRLFMHHIKDVKSLVYNSKFTTGGG